MDLQTYISNAVKVSRLETLANSDQLTLGEVISKCEAIAKRKYKLHDGSEPGVRFDLEYLKPTGIDSWRGSYDELALEFGTEGREPPLSEFIEMLKEADGKTYTGYKGGDYTMSRHTPVWVANYGNIGNTAVIDVVDNDYEIILITGYREF
jgi:hypothetical protein